MNKTIALFYAAFAASLSAGIFAGTGGCGSSSAGGTGGGTGTSSSGTTTSSSGSASVPDCATYCTQELANCTDDTDDNQQYVSTASCLGVCAAYPEGMPGDTTGDSRSCRLYHTGAAQTNPTVHCQHTGLNGGDINPTPNAATICGHACDAFCQVAEAVCPSVFASDAACQMACAAFTPSKSPYNIIEAPAETGNTLNCRVYQLALAATDMAHAMENCPQIIPNNSNDVCK